MPTKIFRTGTKYQLHINGPNNKTNDKISLGIKCDSIFNLETNFVAVILNREMTTKLIDDLKARLEVK